MNQEEEEEEGGGKNVGSGSVAAENFFQVGQFGVDDVAK